MTILTVLAFALLARIPLLGGIVVFIAMLAGIGTIAAWLFRRRGAAAPA